MTIREPQWYAVHTRPMAEAEADLNLRRLGYQTFYPFHRVRCRRKRPQSHAYRVEWIERPYFQGYTFVAVRASDGLGPAMRADGVLAIVQFGGEPLVIPHKVMDELMERANEDGLIGEEDLTAREKLLPGQRLCLDGDTPLSGLIAQVSLDMGKEIRLWVNMFGGKVLARAKPEQVAAI